MAKGAVLGRASWVPGSLKPSHTKSVSLLQVGSSCAKPSCLPLLGVMAQSGNNSLGCGMSGDLVQAILPA